MKKTRSSAARAAADAGAGAVKQPSLFDDSGDAGGGLPTLGIPGSQTALSKEQKLFNRLIAQIETQRELLQQWRDFEPVYQRRIAAELLPLTERLREARIAMVAVLDQTIDEKALGPRHRAKVRDLLLGQLSELLGESRDSELLRLYDKHSDLSFDERQAGEAEFLAEMAESMFGVELDADHGATTPEALARLIAEKMEAEQMQRDQARQATKGRKKSAKATAQQSMREHGAQEASRALREVYRKLASELHPDREVDSVERVRKTALMQSANQAYAAGDLLAMLKLQLSLEQIDSAALTAIAQDRLVHYNRVLDEQSQRLQQELAEVTAPFTMSLQGRMPRQLTPDGVLRALDHDIGELQAMLRSLEADRIAFGDIKVLKSRLRDYRIGSGSDA